jgi:hypothetical protein
LSFLKRIFSSDYRKAIKAEAAGDHLEAAKYYALAENPGKVAKMHLARAETLASHTAAPQQVIDSLQQCLRFATQGSPEQFQAYEQLGTVYRKRAEAEGQGGELSHNLMTLAAENFTRAQCWKDAGDCYLAIDDSSKAAEAYATGGLLDRLEPLLAEREAQQEVERQRRDAYKDYEFYLGSGQRNQAEEALRLCLTSAQDKRDYQGLLEQLEQRKLNEGRVRLKWNEWDYHFVGAPPLTFGRERGCAVVARGASVSRRHAILEFTDSKTVQLRDNNSRNGTLLGGLQIANAIDLPETAEVGLGDSSKLRVQTLSTSPLLLNIEVIGGLDVGAKSFAFDQPIDLRDVLPHAPSIRLAVMDAFPWLEHMNPAETFELNEQRVSGRIELLKGDVVKIGDLSIEVFE